MGPDEKDTGPLTVYMDGQPVGIAGGEIPEISLAEEKPGIYLEGETIDAIRKKAEEIQARNELKTAVRWASAYNRPLAYRYRHTKKKRTRKKYAKRILAWYREEVL